MKLNIFVSSTCFDLKALRESIREKIKQLGHCPLLSEVEEFPVSPDLSTIENCKKVVRDQADLLCLIVGGRRGYVDPSSNRSVVNLEYLEARAKGIDCIIFVDRKVWDLLPHYSKNPTADFSATIDSNGVLEFVAELKKSNRWIFQFDRTEEIAQTLSHQLSVRIRELLIAARTYRTDLPREYLGCSPEIATLVTQKPRFWEYRLTSIMLRERLRQVQQLFSDLESGLVFRRTRYLRTRDSLSHIQALNDDLAGCIEAIKVAVEKEIVGGWGPSGKPGDPVQIQKGCESLHAIARSLFEWELDLRFVRPSHFYLEIVDLMKGWTKQTFSELLRLPDRIDRIVDDPNSFGPHQIDLEIKSPENVALVSQKIDALRENPEFAIHYGTDQ